MSRRLINVLVWKSKSDVGMASIDTNLNFRTYIEGFSLPDKRRISVEKGSTLILRVFLSTNLGLKC